MEAECLESMEIMSSPITLQFITMNLSYTTSKEHRDLMEARIKMDTANLEEISLKLVRHSPILPNPSLRNIVMGVVAE